VTSHLGLDDLASLVATSGPPSAESHLAGCDTCRDRLANLRARSADVSAALAGMGATGALGGGSDDGSGAIESMPDDVMLRITAEMAAAREAQSEAPVDADAAEPNAPADAGAPEPVALGRAGEPRVDELARARARRSRRLRGWLAAAAAVVILGGGFGAVTHFSGGRAADSESASNGAIAAPSDAVSGQLPPAQPSASPGATRGKLLADNFAADVKAYLADQRQHPSPPVAAPKPGSVPRPGSVAGTGSSQCATLARDEAPSIAGGAARGANAAQAVLVGAVAVDGHPGALYVVDVGTVEVAVALFGCSSSSPDVLATATL